MVYMNLLRRSSSRFCQQLQLQQQEALLSAPSVTTAAPIVSASAPIRNFASVATINTRATTTSTTTTSNHRESPFEQELLNCNCNYNHNYNSIAKRSKHSSTQIKRLFKNNPARRRIAKKQDGSEGQRDREREMMLTIPESTIQPVHSDPKILTNGWNAPVGGSSDHPFQVGRTKNKPNNAVGFLPVYSEYR